MRWDLEFIIEICNSQLIYLFYHQFIRKEGKKQRKEKKKKKKNKSRSNLLFTSGSDLRIKAIFLFYDLKFIYLKKVNLLFDSHLRQKPYLFAESVRMITMNLFLSFGMGIISEWIFMPAVWESSTTCKMCLIYCLLGIHQYAKITSPKFYIQNNPRRASWFFNRE